MINKILPIIPMFILASCVKSNTPPVEWTTWVKKAQDRFQKEVSVPSAIQHLYVTSEQGGFYLSEKDKKFKLSLKKQSESDSFFQIDFKKKNFYSKKETPLATQEQNYKHSDRIRLSISVSEEDKKARIFLYDLELKDLNKKRKRDFFNYSKNYIKKARYIKLPKPESVKFGRSDGTTRVFNKVGLLNLDSSNELSVFAEADSPAKEIMLMFKDKTSGDSTYGAGRYVVVELSKAVGELENGSSVTIDFNYTFNPPCAVSTGFHCPLAQDFLDIHILAGEMYNH